MQGLVLFLDKCQTFDLYLTCLVIKIQIKYLIIRILYENQK